MVIKVIQLQVSGTHKTYFFNTQNGFLLAIFYISC